MNKKDIKEVDVAKSVVLWLKEYNWTVYQEVKIPHFSKVADIIAVQNNIVWVIETKTTLGLKVIAQADCWRFKANYLSVATPSNRDTDIRNLIDDFLLWRGIGRLNVNHNFINADANDVYESSRPKLNRKVNVKSILDNLTEEHKTYAEAGNNKGSYYSPFKNTCRNVIQEVGINPGILLGDLIKKIKHHYYTPESAKSSILEWTRQGIIKGVNVKIIDRKYRFYLDD